jgi:protein-S-isoprenylcysteine O-methyltransferase Ste14
VILFHSEAITAVVDLIMLVCWLGIIAILLMGKRRAAPGAQHSDPKSILGFLLQVAGYLICFAAFRPLFSPPFRITETGEAVLAAFTVAIGVASTWLCYSAARALGRHWALMARVIAGHELVRSGPYALVRNPIYLAMFGLVIATALAFSRWQALAPAVAVYWIGTRLRIRAEEKLLHGAFGAEFEEYSRRVPALFPRLI